MRLQVWVLELLVSPFTTNFLRNIKKPTESVAKDKKDKGKDKKPAKRAKDPKDSKDVDAPQPSKSKKTKTK